MKRHTLDVLARAFVFSLALATCLASSASENGAEHARLTAILRQLDLIERLAHDSAAVAPVSGTRYHFDYARLCADLARMRIGIEDYLSPPRAQPRDLTPLDGTYRREVSPP